MGETKTTCGVRKIYIKKEVYDVLQRWKEYMESDSELAYKRAVNKTKGYVFVNRNGQTINSNSLRNTMNRYLKKRAKEMEASGQYDAQEIRIRFHDLRHPYVKHTTKKYNSEKQKTQATKIEDLIAWGFCFCIVSYSKRSWTL